MGEGTQHQYNVMFYLLEMALTNDNSILPHRPNWCLTLEHWTHSPYVWDAYVPSQERLLDDDDCLMSPDTKYWSIHNPQRFWVLDFHCEKGIFTCQYPKMKLPTPLGKYFWLSNTFIKQHGNLYSKEKNLAVEVTLKKMQANMSQMDRLIVPDQLIRVERLDSGKRNNFFRVLKNIMSFQDRLQLVSLENLKASRTEGTQLLQCLSCFNTDTLKYLYLWHFVRCNQNPVLLDYSYLTGSGLYVERVPRAANFIHSLRSFKKLKVLAVNYSYLADQQGQAMLALEPLFSKPSFILQLLCLEENVPDKRDPIRGVGGHRIPDTAWRIIATNCPNLYLQMAFVCVRDYESVQRFLSPSVPLSAISLQMGIDLNLPFRSDSDLSCVVRLLKHRYENCLVELSFHQWRSAAFSLGSLVTLFPRLSTLHYVGRVLCGRDLRRMLDVIACGVCPRMRSLKVFVQSTEESCDQWKVCIQKFTEQYIDIMQVLDIDMELSVLTI